MAIRVIVAGMGERGREWVREIRAEPPYSLAACVDPDERALRESATTLSLKPEDCFLRLEDALERVAADAVVVATSADCHGETCEAALLRGRAVLVEKPFTTNLNEAVVLVRLAEEKALPLLVAQNYRYMRSFRAVRRLVSDGTLGPVGMVTCQYFRVPHQMVASLRRLRHSVLWGMGVHHLDALRYVLNQKVTNVFADGFTLPWGELPHGASTRVMMELEEGTRALYSATYESSGHEFFERGQEFYARFTGERATLHVFQRWLVLCERGRWPRIIRRGRREVSEERLLLRQLGRALATAAEVESSGRDNLQTMAVIEACLRSETEGRWVSPQELLDEAEKPQSCLSHRA
jgi:predicted dehydrogenase